MYVRSTPSVALVMFAALVGCDGSTNPLATASRPAGIRKINRFLVTYAPSYVAKVRAQDLGTLPGDVSSIALDVNDAGQIVGESDDAQGHGHAVLWAPGGVSVQNLGSLGGTTSRATGINASGAVTGYSVISPARTEAFLWNGSGMSQLVAIQHGDTLAYALPGRINDAGIVVGSTEDVIYGPSAAYWLPGSSLAQYVDSAGYAMTASAISDSGTIVGHDYEFGDRCYYNKVGTFGPTDWMGPTSPGPGQFLDCYPTGVNTGTLVSGYGEYVRPSGFPTNHAFESDGITMHNLGTLVPSDTAANSMGTDIDEQGLVVGFSNVGPEPFPTIESFLWSGDFGMVGLGWPIPGIGSSAWGTNPHLLGDSILVVGSSTTLAATHATLWSVTLGLTPHVTYIPDKSYNPTPSIYWGWTYTNPASDRYIQVIMYGGPNFDATTVNLQTLRLNGVSPSSTSFLDANGDGLTDLMMLFSLHQLITSGGITQQTQQLNVSGNLLRIGTPLMEILPVTICTTTACLPDITVSNSPLGG